MFRTFSFLGLAAVFLILALTAVLFSFRIVEDENGNRVTVLLLVSLSLVGVALCGVYFARRREREDYELARKAAALEEPAVPPNDAIGPQGTAVQS